MKWVYPVRYQMISSKESDQYFIVAENPQQAEEIAFDCIANTYSPNFSDASDRPASYGREIAHVWVMNDWAQQTETDKIGLVGSGSEVLLAKALALYVKTYNQLH
jgi:hypothetical protein